jgi:predicted RNase H-like HicB family nuclease
MPRIQYTVQFPLRIVIYPAPDLEGQWIAHCLETDVVTQGDSVDHALQMMAEALEAISKFNLSHGRFPVALTPAPREIWELVDIEKPAGIVANVTVSSRDARKRAPEIPDTLPLFAFVSKHAPGPRNARKV